MPVRDGVRPSGTVPPVHLPLRLEAATLSRTRSEDSSRSNWAKDNRTFRVNRPIEVVVLNCWVTATNEIDLASKASTSLAKSASDRVVDNDDIDPAGVNVLQELLKGRAVEIAAGIGGVVVMLGQGPPSLRGLTLYICFAGIPLGIERVELQFQAMLGRLAGV